MTHSSADGGDIGSKQKQKKGGGAAARQYRLYPMTSASPQIFARPVKARKLHCRTASAAQCPARRGKRKAPPRPNGNAHLATGSVPDYFSPPALPKWLRRALVELKPPRPPGTDGGVSTRRAPTNGIGHAQPGVRAPDATGKNTADAEPPRR